jgi:RND family efflux transporter MFP subunit
MRTHSKPRRSRPDAGGNIGILPGLVLFGFALAGIAVLGGCGGNGNGNDVDQGIPVVTARVGYEEVSIPVRTSGKLTSATEARLSFKTGGILGSVLADEGETVKRGQLLAALKSEEIDARVTQARSGFEKAERDMKRARRLYADSVITLEQMQDAETGFSVAESQLKIAEFNQVHSSISAPTDGRILKRFVEINELVGPGSPVFLFGSSVGRWTVRAGIADRDIIRLSLGDSAAVRFDAYRGLDFPARVVEIGEAADPMSGAFEIELSLDDRGMKLVSGFIARIDIFPTSCQPMHTVPIEALMEADGDRGYVYVPDGETGTVAKKAIVLGCLIGEKAAVISGLEGESLVVTRGAAYLTDKAEIRIVEGPAGDGPGNVTGQDDSGGTDDGGDSDRPDAE